MQLTSAASPPVAGYLFDHVSLALPFSLGGILQLLSAGLYYAFFHGWLPPEEAERQREASTLTKPVEPHAAD